MNNDEVLIRLKDLIRLTQEEIALLRTIAKEGRDTGKDFHDADRAADVLQERLPRMIKDAADPAAPDFRKKAKIWGAQMASIERVVDAIYPSSHEAEQTDLQNRIGDQGLWLDNGAK